MGADVIGPTIAISRFMTTGAVLRSVAISALLLVLSTAARSAHAGASFGQGFGQAPGVRRAVKTSRAPRTGTREAPVRRDLLAALGRGQSRLLVVTSRSGRGRRDVLPRPQGGTDELKYLQFQVRQVGQWLHETRRLYVSAFTDGGAASGQLYKVLARTMHQLTTPQLHVVAKADGKRETLVEFASSQPELLGQLHEAALQAHQTLVALLMRAGQVALRLESGDPVAAVHSLRALANQRLELGLEPLEPDDPAQWPLQLEMARLYRSHRWFEQLFEPAPAAGISESLEVPQTTGFALREPPELLLEKVAKLDHAMQLYLGSHLNDRLDALLPLAEVVEASRSAGSAATPVTGGRGGTRWSSAPVDPVPGPEARGGRLGGRRIHRHQGR
jgi:hypothetical protein